MGPEFEYSDSPKGQMTEEEEHRKYAQSLRDAIIQHCAERRDSGGDPELWSINVRCFLMDLRGSVKMLIPEGENYDF